LASAEGAGQGEAIDLGLDFCRIFAVNDLGGKYITVFALSSQDAGDYKQFSKRDLRGAIIIYGNAPRITIDLILR
jgi:hypothetical protein